MKYTPFTVTALRREFGAGWPVWWLKMADRLHNMRTLEFLTPPKQLRKAREVLDIFASAAEQLSLPAIGTELQTLAFATLIRNQPARPPSHRTAARHGHNGIDLGPCHRQIVVRVGDEYRSGRVFLLA